VEAGQKTILVVDDEPFFRDEVVAFLNSPAFAERGWKVEAVASGEEALARLEQAPYDVMLLDINMPGMDGMEVLRAMHEKQASSGRNCAAASSRSRRNCDF